MGSGKGNFGLSFMALAVLCVLSIFLVPRDVYDALHHGLNHLTETTKPHAHELWHAARSLIPRQNVGGSNALRILPIGDSITEGFRSSDGNGYRLALRNMLTSSGSSVDFVGATASGNNNADNQHEGFGGYRISQIRQRMESDRILGQRPNVVLIMAGTNDVNQDPAQEPYDGAPDRLAQLIDLVLCQSPDAVVLVALIAQIPRSQARVDRFNAAIPKIVAARYSRGFKIRVVDHTSIGPSDLPDGLHPSDSGYNKMADIWMRALRGLPSGWITKARDPVSGSTRAETCARDGLYWYPVRNKEQIALGASVPGDKGEPAANNAPFIPWWNPRGRVAAGIAKNGSEIYLYDIDGDGLSDYMWLNPTNGALSNVYLNKGGGNWQLLNAGKDIALGTGTGFGVHMADLNGDKRYDYIVSDNSGNIKVWLNGGPYGTSWRWNPLSGNISPGGTTIDNVIFGDLNGDGRADLMVIRPSGVIDAFIQLSGLENGAIQWHTCPNSATAVGNPRPRLADFNGDGRADFVSIDDVGGMTGWVNTPTQGSPCPTWVQIGGRQGIASGAGPGNQVRLAYMAGDSKIDYVVVEQSSGALDLWENTGSINNNTTPTKISGLGAAVRLVDLNGDSRDDYISVGPNSEAIAYVNGGETSNGWLWSPQAQGKLIALGHSGAKRHQIHFADINGDGLADYLVVDDVKGSVICYYNGGATSDGWIWRPQGEIAAGGIGDGAGVRFADLNGDGRADYLWLDPDGKMIAYLNYGQGDNFQGWFPVNDRQFIASGVGGKREDIRLKDLDGDGRADYLWVKPDNGATEVWYNGGPYGSGWFWQPGGQIAAGIGLPGRQVEFARLGISGRVDYVGIEESKGALVAYYNLCNKVIGGSSTGGGGGGDGSCGAPPLSPPTSPDPGSPNTPDNPRPPTCEGSSCSPCSGSSCSGCTGDCSGCSGTDCGGCSGPECFSCFGLGCPLCRTSNCFSCRGRDCDIDGGGGGGGGRLRCIGPLCNTCVGSSCSGCRGPLCTVCRGADCRGGSRGCLGGNCEICSGDCEGCSGSSCERCSGGDCGSTNPQNPDNPDPTGPDPPPGPPPGNPNSPSPSNSVCSRTITLSDCSITCTKTVIGETSTTTRCPSTSCSSTRSACSGTGNTGTTTTTTAQCPASTSGYTWRPGGNIPPPTLCRDNVWRQTCTTTPRPSSTQNNGPSTTSVAVTASTRASCNNEADFPGHGDVREVDVEGFSLDFCDEYETRNLGPGQSISRRYKNDFNVNFDYLLSWRANCRTSVGQQNVGDPMGKGGVPYCADIFNDAFYGCNNGGVGGTMNVGCLAYAFTGGR